MQKKEIQEYWEVFEDDMREHMIRTVICRIRGLNAEIELEEPNVVMIEADEETVNDSSSNEVIVIIDTMATGRREARDDDCIILGDDYCFICPSFTG